MGLLMGYHFTSKMGLIMGFQMYHYFFWFYFSICFGLQKQWILEQKTQWEMTHISLDEPVSTMKKIAKRRPEGHQVYDHSNTWSFPHHFLHIFPIIYARKPWLGIGVVHLDRPWTGPSKGTRLERLRWLRPPLKEEIRSWKNGERIWEITCWIWYTYSTVCVCI